MSRRLAELSAAERRHLVAALIALLRAKALHLRLDAPAIFARLRAPADPGRGPARSAPPDPALMRWSLAAVSRRVPWRSDCLVQALAGKLWLERAGLSGRLHLGAALDEDGGLIAHAWLTLEGETITGGEADPQLAPFVASDAGASAENTQEDQRPKRIRDHSKMEE